MNEFDRIVSDPRVLDGQPCVKGTRLTVRRVLSILATNPTRDRLREDYPQLADADIEQALAYAASVLDDRVVELRPAS